MSDTENAAGRLMRAGLHHKWSIRSDAEFFKLIDETGGWPIGYDFVGFEHTDERDAGFCRASHNTGWWTVLNSADDYYMWKLSPEAMQRIIDGVVSACSVTKPTVKGIRILSFRGVAELRMPK